AVSVCVQPDPGGGGRLRFDTADLLYLGDQRPPVERRIKGENVAIHDAAPRVPGSLPAPNALSPLRTEPGRLGTASRIPRPRQSVGLRPGVSGAWASGRSLSGPGRSVLSGGLLL